MWFRSFGCVRFGPIDADTEARLEDVFDKPFVQEVEHKDGEQQKQYGTCRRKTNTHEA